MDDSAHNRQGSRPQFAQGSVVVIPPCFLHCILYMFTNVFRADYSMIRFSASFRGHRRRRRRPSDVGPRFRTGHPRRLAARLLCFDHHLCTPATAPPSPLIYNALEIPFDCLLRCVRPYPPRSGLTLAEQSWQVGQCPAPCASAFGDSLTRKVARAR